MPESRPRRPLADGLSRACFDGDLASVQQYLAEGADLLAPRPAGRGGGKQCMDLSDSVFLAIHECSLFARADCLRALTLASWGRTLAHMSMLVLVCGVMAVVGRSSGANDRLRGRVIISSNEHTRLLLRLLLVVRVQQTETSKTRRAPRGCTGPAHP